MTGNSSGNTAVFSPLYCSYAIPCHKYCRIAIIVSSNIRNSFVGFTRLSDTPGIEFPSLNEGPIGLDGPKGDPGRPGDKGQKGELGSPGFDVYAAVKGLREQGHNISAEQVVMLKVSYI
ncbi:hypothetical protein M8J77_000342 [Diaphorina citri]|nr:hypothetical protein M8J77_000342 [Diaphorina citri]